MNTLFDIFLGRALGIHFSSIFVDFAGVFGFPEPNFDLLGAPWEHLGPTLDDLFGVRVFFKQFLMISRGPKSKYGVMATQPSGAVVI